MRAFTRLFEDLDATTSTLEKVAALKLYFETTKPEDAIWAVLILTSRVQKKNITSRTLRDLFLQATGYQEWLFEESYHHVGDTAETLSLLASTLGLTALNPEPAYEKTLSTWLTIEIPALAKIKDNDAERSRVLLGWWKHLTTSEVFILNKLMTGGFRVGVSEKLVVRALAEVYDVPTDVVAHRMTGKFPATPEAFARLISKDEVEKSWSQPYPFCLAHTWTDRSEQSFRPEDWCVEWKYDGIRSQVIKRDGKIMIWSRGEELINESFPDLAALLMKLPDGTVLDGEVLVMREGLVADFNELQKRLGRKKVSAAVLADLPAGYIAYDCIEFGGEDLRDKTLRGRREFLKQALESVNGSQILISEAMDIASAEDLERLRAAARDHQAEGVMLKAWDSKYVVGRKVGGWWKHKVDPLTLDAVLLYAQAGTGRRANLHTDYTFALWRGEDLVPFTKAYSGLDDKEINELDYWIRRHTKEKFGPVRSVEPFHVFEIGFEGIALSNRHKSGIAVRFPRILRWRKDKTYKDADSLQTAMELLDTTPALEAGPEV